MNDHEQSIELVERYLQAVRFWLPKEQKQDIIAELSEDLHSQIEEKETDLGRPLYETELGAILKNCGSPMLVASRYQPQRHLIGPAWFSHLPLGAQAGTAVGFWYRYSW